MGQHARQHARFRPNELVACNRRRLSVGRRVAFERCAPGPRYRTASITIANVLMRKHLETTQRPQEQQANIMPTRHFFLRFPFVPYAATIAVLVALIVAVKVIAASLDGVAPASATGDPVGSFVGGLQLGLLAMLVFLGVLMPLRIRTRPMLTLENDRLIIGAVKIGWPAIAEFVPLLSWNRPMIGIKTVNDDAVLKRLPPAARFIYTLRRWRIGMLFCIPEIREISMPELMELLEAYRAASASDRTKQ